MLGGRSATALPPLTTIALPAAVDSGVLGGLLSVPLELVGTSANIFLLPAVSAALAKYVVGSRAECCCCYFLHGVGPSRTHLQSPEHPVVNRGGRPPTS